MAYMKDSTGRRLDSFQVLGDHGLTAAVPYQGLIPIADHTGAPDQNGGQSNGTRVAGAYRMQHRILTSGPVKWITCQLSNYHAVGYTGEIVGPNPISVQFCIELGNGTMIPATFNDGEMSVTINPGQSVWTDPIPIEHKGSADTYPHIWSRTVVTVAAGQKWCYTNIVQGAAGSARPGEGVTESDTPLGATLYRSGTITAANSNAYGPLQILGSTDDVKPVIGIIGDSIASGADDSDGVQGGWSRRGFFMRRFEQDKIPFVRVSNAGDRLFNWLQRDKSVRRRRMLPGVDHVICEYGINDLFGGGSTSADVKQWLVTGWREMADMGAKVWQTTLTPVASSTDSFATTTNQTANALHPRRIEVNDWIRAGAPIDPATKAPVAIGTGGALVAGQAGHPLSGYHEIADVVESSRNSGLWKVDGTAFAYVKADGLHPTTKSHILMGAALNLAQMGY